MKISDFKNKYKGEIGFILGGGPSLHNIDIDLIKDHVCIAVNSGIVKYPDSDFFISDDVDIKGWNYYSDIIKNSNCIKFLYEKKFKNICKELNNFILFSHTWWFSPEDKTYNLDGLKLTKNEPIIGARLSTASALHILYIMGCDPIILLGNDCQLSKDKHQFRYFWQFPGEKKQYRIKGRKFTHQTQNRGFNEKDFKEYWNCFAKVNKNILGKDVDIIDASDSSLNCFPKMTIKEILDKYGELR